MGLGAVVGDHCCWMLVQGPKCAVLASLRGDLKAWLFLGPR